jgi:hypothetical protein
MRSLTERYLSIFIISTSLLSFSSCKPGEAIELSVIKDKTNLIVQDAPLELSAGSFRFSDSSYATSCLEYLESDNYDNEGDATYWIEPSTGNIIEALCDMTMNGGGWTLLSNRRTGSTNTEDCGVNLNDFFQSPCGDVNMISLTESYNIGDSSMRSILSSRGDFMFLQYTIGGILDSDDAFIIHLPALTDLLFDSTGVINRTPVSSVCDINDSNCDSSDVFFVWVGDGWWPNAHCHQGYATGALVGNYGYCHNGVSTSYDSNSLFGNRSEYTETKLWNHNNAAKNYQERIWVR